jgi:hypothetical protein
MDRGTPFTSTAPGFEDARSQSAIGDDALQLPHMVVPWLAEQYGQTVCVANVSNGFPQARHFHSGPIGGFAPHFGQANPSRSGRRASRLDLLAAPMGAQAKSNVATAKNMTATRFQFSMSGERSKRNPELTVSAPNITASATSLQADRGGRGCRSRALKAWNSSLEGRYLPWRAFLPNHFARITNGRMSGIRRMMKNRNRPPGVKSLCQASGLLSSLCNAASGTTHSARLSRIRMPVRVQYEWRSSRVIGVHCAVGAIPRVRCSWSELNTRGSPPTRSKDSHEAGGAE